MGLLETYAHIQPRVSSEGSYWGYEGTIVADSYNPEDGTVLVAVGETLANSGFGDPDEGGLQLPGALMTQMVGFQAAPMGGERCMLFPVRGGLKVMLTHGKDNAGTDAPFGTGAPVGELWYAHAKAGTLGAGNNPVFDSGFKVTNDGTTEGDGLGGAHFGEQADQTTTDTATGHQVSLSDTNKQIVVKTAGVGNPNPLTTTYDDPSQTIKHAVASVIFTVLDAINQKITHQAGTQVSTELIDSETVQQIIHEAGTNVQTVVDGILQTITHQANPNVMTIVDGGGNAISHVIPTGGSVALGALAGAGSLVPAISKTDMTTLISNSSTGINIQRWVDLLLTMKAMLLAMTSSGVPSLPNISAIVAEMASVFGTSVPRIDQLPAWSSILVPSGSAHVSLIP